LKNNDKLQNAAPDRGAAPPAQMIAQERRPFNQRWPARILESGEGWIARTTEPSRQSSA
jgi:hypothetical protein